MILRVRGAVSPGVSTGSTSGCSTIHPFSPLTQIVGYGLESAFPICTTVNSTWEPDGSISRLASSAYTAHPGTLLISRLKPKLLISSPCALAETETCINEPFQASAGIVAFTISEVESLTPTPSAELPSTTQLLESSSPIRLRL